MEQLKKRTNERKDAIFYLYQKDLLSEAILDDFNEYTKFLIDNVIAKMTEIDEIIKKCLTNYALNRLSFLDRAIVRVATLEMMIKEVPYQIIINEALEITKIYTNLDENKEKAFNNKLLDSIKTLLEKEE